MKKLKQKCDKWVDKHKLIMAFSFTIAVGLLITTAYISFLTPTMAQIYNSPDIAQTALKSPNIASEGTIREKVWSVLGEYELSFDEKLMFMQVLNCESKFDEYAIGVNNNGTVDVGIAQFNSQYFKDRVCYFNWRCAIEKMVEIYQTEGNLNKWVCSRKI